MRRYTHAWVVAMCTQLFGRAMFGQITTVWSVIVVGGVACIAASVIARLNVKWLIRCSRETSASLAHVLAVERVRRQRKSLMWTAWLALLALPLFGGGWVLLSIEPGSAEFGQLDGAIDLALMTFGVGLCLFVAAWFTGFGSPHADLGAMVLLAVGGWLWLRQEAACGLVGAVVQWLTALWALVRVVRHRVPRSPVEAPSAHPEVL
jgi:hypothetical protein